MNDEETAGSAVSGNHDEGDNDDDDDGGTPQTKQPKVGYGDSGRVTCPTSMMFCC